MLIKRRVVSEFAVGPSDSGAAFIEQAGQNDVTAETAVRAAWGAFRKIGRGDFGQFGHNQSTIGHTGKRSKILLLFDFQFRIGFHAFMKYFLRASAV
jgi:hypothetical protein